MIDLHFTDKTSWLLFAMQDVACDWVFLHCVITDLTEVKHLKTSSATAILCPDHDKYSTIRTSINLSDCGRVIFSKHSESSSAIEILVSVWYLSFGTQTTPFFFRCLALININVFLQSLFFTQVKKPTLEKVYCCQNTTSNYSLKLAKYSKIKNYL